MPTTSYLVRQALHLEVLLSQALLDLLLLHEGSVSEVAFQSMHLHIATFVSIRPDASGKTACATFCLYLVTTCCCCAYRPASSCSAPYNCTHSISTTPHQRFSTPYLFNLGTKLFAVFLRNALHLLDHLHGLCLHLSNLSQILDLPLQSGTSLFQRQVLLGQLLQQLLSVRSRISPFQLRVEVLRETTED